LKRLPAFAHNAWGCISAKPDYRMFIAEQHLFENKIITNRFFAIALNDDEVRHPEGGQQLKDLIIEKL
jgi:hypothetical protein